MARFLRNISFAHAVEAAMIVAVAAWLTMEVLSWFLLTVILKAG